MVMELNETERTLPPKADFPPETQPQGVISLVRTLSVAAPKDFCRKRPGCDKQKGNFHLPRDLGTDFGPGTMRDGILRVPKAGRVTKCLTLSSITKDVFSRSNYYDLMVGQSKMPTVVDPVATRVPGEWRADSTPI